MNGTISKIVADKGFGFVRLVGGGEYFFHKSDVDTAICSFGDITEGDSVTFEEVQPRPSKGPRATRIALR